MLQFHKLVYSKVNLKHKLPTTFTGGFIWLAAKPLIKTLNRFSPLSDTPTEKPDENALVIGYSIEWKVKIETPATIVHCLP